MARIQGPQRRSATPFLLPSSPAVVSAALLLSVAGVPAALAQGTGADTTPRPPRTGSTGPAAALNGLLPDADGGTPGRSPLASAEARRDRQEKLRVDDQLVVDLHVQDEDLANVLEMLSIQSQRNIVASRNVSARVTANLYGVTFYQALDAILHANGYGYIEKGNFIYVYTLEELEQIEEATRVRVSRVVKLNYLNATDAAEFVKPLLSEGGQIKTNGKTAAFPSMGETPVGMDDFANEATLVIYDFEENLGEVQQMLKELDTKPAQVLVEATILQTSLNEANAFGVDFALIADLNFRDFAPGWASPLQAVNALNAGRAVPGNNALALPGDESGRSVVSSPGNTSGPATLKLGIVENDVAVFLRVLDEVTDTTILSNPKILALNRMPSRVLVGRKVGYISTTSTDTATTQTVQFLDTGTQLYFRPFVTNEGMIRMELKPQVSEAQIRDVKDASGAAVTIPDEITNELVTNVIVGDGQTIVLGGLFRESTVTTRRQVPFLGDIPIVGNAFRGNDDANQRSEIIFLITPSIVNEQVLNTQAARAMDNVERARTGAREGLLFFSRDKLTGQLNVEADRLAAEGKTDKALWKLRQSLWMNPAQPDAIALRERVSGKVKPLSNRSMLDDIVRGETINRRRYTNDGRSSGAATTDPNTSFTPDLSAPTPGNAPANTDTTHTGDQAGEPNAFNTTNGANTDTGSPCAEPTFTPAASTGGRFAGLFRMAVAFRDARESENSTFTGVSDEPMSDSK